MARHAKHARWCIKIRSSRAMFTARWWASSITKILTSNPIRKGEFPNDVYYTRLIMRYITSARSGLDLFTTSLWYCFDLCSLFYRVHQKLTLNGISVKCFINDKIVCKIRQFNNQSLLKIFGIFVLFWSNTISYHKFLNRTNDFSALRYLSIKDHRTLLN